jgi:NhaP-type Na+/H+ or K+/H+ antiporter
MSAWLIALVGAIYAYIAAEQLFRGNPYMAVVYAGYAFSNVGLYLLTK